MADFFLPVLSHFENENPWSASAGRLRYRIAPVIPKGEDKKPLPQGAALEVQVWEGPWELNLSTVEEVASFPLSAEGLEAIRAYLEQWRRAVEERPERTLEENIARRVERNE